MPGILDTLQARGRGRGAPTIRTPCTRTCDARTVRVPRMPCAPCTHRARTGAGGGGVQGDELGGAAGDPQEERAVARRGLLDLERGRVGRVEVRCGRRATKARPHYKPPRRRPRKHSPTSQGPRAPLFLPSTPNSCARLLPRNPRHRYSNQCLDRCKNYTYG